MNINVATTVRDLAVTVPGATRVFERLGIDYCCGGHRTLADACIKANVPVEQVTASLAQGDSAPAESQNWAAASMTALIHHIVEKHHTFTKEELPRLEKLIHKVCTVHSAQHPELLQLQAVFLALKQELEPHLFKEEQVLFPYVTKLEAALTKDGNIPFSCFGTVQNPVRMMMLEHEAAGDLLKEMRNITNNYALPAGVCISYETLYQALAEFEADLHQHIHLENNVLFPNALAAERGI
ncbi:MAG TPA: iron-sulfur cluster repair di-iron protein [Blastocatellia bacterium]|nr:iron-sulfur cluster repair di-iron protein [Blastocatellia bacterium]